ncbi:uncharacterized protein MELLADRAFT_94458 [Melampsora larici-populina 98AG31]|uniref:Uncharacterized protein n=1 Tax=Melampsora larici-populina (strain 98AG31 / pathotype 3-4-7) TaxID=747676 RepID=F4RB29_MELLP|nr:uncharacterized protein MELLADRAFT_94458 [Melampsora larici-populina 98AG31]EGG10335.1 hypothetical protein MELLADRAFT_94458 [Melampsora larici-populina 98AG31]
MNPTSSSNSDHFIPVSKPQKGYVAKDYATARSDFDIVEIKRFFPFLFCFLFQVWPLGGPAFVRLCRGLPDPTPSFLYQLDQIDLANKYLHPSSVEVSKNDVNFRYTLEGNDQVGNSSIQSFISSSALSPELKEGFGRASSIETSTSRSIFTDKRSHFSQSSPISSIHELPSPGLAVKANQISNLDGAPILDHDDVLRSEPIASISTGESQPTVKLKSLNNTQAFNEQNDMEIDTNFVAIMGGNSHKLNQKRPHLLDDAASLSNTNKKNKTKPDKVLDDHRWSSSFQNVQKPGKDSHSQHEDITVCKAVESCRPSSASSVDLFLATCIPPAVLLSEPSSHQKPPASLPQRPSQYPERTSGPTSTYSDHRRPPMGWDHKTKHHSSSQKSDLSRSESSQHRSPCAKITSQHIQSSRHERYSDTENWPRNHDRKESGSKVLPHNTLASDLSSQRLTLGSASNNIPMPFVRSFVSKPQSETRVPEQVPAEGEIEICIPELLDAIKTVKSSRLRSEGYVGDEAMETGSMSFNAQPLDMKKIDVKKIDAKKIDAKKNPLTSSKASNVESRSTIDEDERDSQRKGSFKLDDKFPLDAYILNVIEDSTSTHERWIVEAFCRVGIWLEEKGVWEHGNWGCLLSNQLARFIDLGGKDRLSKLLAADRPLKFEEILKHTKKFDRILAINTKDGLMHIRLMKDFTPRGLFYHTLIRAMRQYTYTNRTAVVDRNKLETGFIIPKTGRVSDILPPYTNFRKYTRWAETEGVIVVISRTKSAAKDLKLTSPWLHAAYKDEPAPEVKLERSVVEEIESLMAQLQ